MEIVITGRVEGYTIKKTYHGITPKQAKTDFKMLYPQARGLVVEEGNRVKRVDTLESIFVAV